MDMFYKNTVRMSIPMDKKIHIDNLESHLIELLSYIKKLKRSPYPENEKVFLTQCAVNTTHRSLKADANPNEANKEFRYKGST